MTSTPRAVSGGAAHAETGSANRRHAQRGRL